MAAFLIYAVYFPIKKLIKNEPVLLLNKSGIEINVKGKLNSFSWLQITNWKIEKDDDGRTSFLIVETTDTKKKINITWLDKQPSEIEEVLNRLKPN